MLGLGGASRKRHGLQKNFGKGEFRAGVELPIIRTMDYIRHATKLEWVTAITRES